MNQLHHQRVQTLCNMLSLLPSSHLNTYKCMKFWSSNSWIISTLRLNKPFTTHWICYSALHMLTHAGNPSSWYGWIRTTLIGYRVWTLHNVLSLLPSIPSTYKWSAKDVVFEETRILLWFLVTCISVMMMPLHQCFFLKESHLSQICQKGSHIMSLANIIWFWTCLHALLQGWQYSLQIPL